MLAKLKHFKILERVIEQFIPNDRISGNPSILIDLCVALLLRDSQAKSFAHYYMERFPNGTKSNHSSFWSLFARIITSKDLDKN